MNKLDTELVNDIYYKLDDAWDFKTVPENNDILGRIKENIKIYGNLPIDEIDTEHSWIKIQSPKIFSMKFIKTKGYEKHLKLCNEIDERNQILINKQSEFYKKNGYGKGFFPYQPIEEHPTPWDNFLVLKAYRCIKTKAIGFTYYVKNTYALKPFHVIKHDWEFKTINNRNFEYICKNCGIDGIKYKDMPSGEIFPTADFMLSCNEHMIKKLLE